MHTLQTVVNIVVIKAKGETSFSPFRSIVSNKEITVRRVVHVMPIQLERGKIWQ